MRAYEILIFCRHRDGNPLYYRAFNNIMDSRFFDDEIDTVKQNVKQRCEYLIENDPSCHTAKAKLYEVLDNGDKVFLETFVDLSK